MEQSLKTLLGNPIEPYTGDIIKPGVICTAAIPYVGDRFNVIRPLSYDTADTSSDKYQLTEVPYKELCTGTDGMSKLPHIGLGLRSGEDFLVCKVKKRPVIVLSQPLSKPEVKGFPKHFTHRILCAPLYTIVDGGSKRNINYSKETVQNIVALKYPWVFPIPGFPYLNSVMNALRLDTIQPVHMRCLFNTKIKLTRKWLAFVREWIRFFGTGNLAANKIAQFLATARELLLDEIKK
jgi:hypothetical protein